MAKQNTSNETGNALDAVFGKKNYIILAVGLLFMAAGFLLMLGGKTTDPAVFNPAELYSPMRITVAPILILVGIVINIYAILAKNK